MKIILEKDTDIKALEAKINKHMADLALAGVAIIYSMGANESQKGRRIFFGVLGVIMIIAFVCASVYLHKYGWPL